MFQLSGEEAEVMRGNPGASACWVRAIALWFAVAAGGVGPRGRRSCGWTSVVCTITSASTAPERPTIAPPRRASCPGPRWCDRLSDRRDQVFGPLATGHQVADGINRCGKRLLATAGVVIRSTLSTTVYVSLASLSMTDSIWLSGMSLRRLTAIFASPMPPAFRAFRSRGR